MTYLLIGIAVIVVGVIALVIRAQRHTYHADSGGSMGAKGRSTKRDSQGRASEWGAGGF